MRLISRHRLPAGPLMLTLALALVLAAMSATAARRTAPAVSGALEAQDDGVRSYRVGNAVTREDRSAVASTGAGIVEIGADYVIVRATAREAIQIAALGYAIEERAAAQDFPPADEAFHNYAELTSEIQRVAAAHPGLVSYSSIGKSYEGRDLWVVKISDNVNVDEAEPEVLFLGLHHAGEHLSVEMTLYIMTLLAEQYGVDAQITNLVNTREVYIIVNANPDGGEYDIATGAYWTWRKNRQPNPGSSDVGTDLNRNYGYQWGCCGGSSNMPDSETYRGSAAFSSPEIAHVRDFIEGRVVNGRQQIRTSISFHAYGELVLWPFGYTYADVTAGMDADDHAVFVAMGDTWRAPTATRRSRRATCTSPMGRTRTGPTGRTASSSAPSSCTRRRPIPGYYPPASVIARETSRNEAAVRYILEQADRPYRSIGRGSAVLQHGAADSARVAVAGDAVLRRDEHERDVESADAGADGDGGLQRADDRVVDGDGESVVGADHGGRGDGERDVHGRDHQPGERAGGGDARRPRRSR